MTNSLISIVLCSYNGERFIKEQIDSLLHQTYPNLEIIISDDASTDGTRKILEEYKNDKRIKLFLQAGNLGPSKNFEFALQQAKGEYIAFSDQDDIWLPGKIEKLYSVIGDKLLAYSDSELIREDGKPLHKYLSDLRKMYSGNETYGFIFSNVVWGHTMMINKKLLTEVLPIPRDTPHDIWFAFKAASVSGIKFLPASLALYRQHNETMTKTLPVKAQRRAKSQVAIDFKKKLEWMSIMKENARTDEKYFYDRLYALYDAKKNGKFVWELFFFLLRNRKKIFMFSRKNYLSHFVEILKQSWGIDNYQGQ